MLIDVIVLKSFGGLSEGQFTQLREFEFDKLAKDGFCEKIGTAKTAPKNESIIESKKGTKK